MNCSNTRACISLFEVLPEPPRIMLTRPRISTMTTATMTRMQDVEDGCHRLSCSGSALQAQDAIERRGGRMRFSNTPIFAGQVTT